MTPRATPLVLLLLLCAACADEPEGAEPTAGAAAPTDTTETFQGRVFERSITFVTPRSDSVMIVPWLFEARTLPGGVRREVRGLLARGATWESFLDDTWETPPTRLPWRLLPRNPMGLVVGNEDALEQILFDEGPRQLDLILREPLVDWTGPRGESFRLLQGTLVLSNANVEGYLLDLTRAYPLREPSGGDWGIVVSGDSLQVLLHASEATPAGAEGAFRVWARQNLHELHWPEVTVAWTQTRAFERARREVPSTFSVTSDDGQLRGELTVVAAELQAGEGTDPQLPVDGLLEVSGTIRIGGLDYPVRGFLRHIQP